MTPYQQQKRAGVVAQAIIDQLATAGPQVVYLKGGVGITTIAVRSDEVADELMDRAQTTTGLFLLGYYLPGIKPKAVREDVLHAHTTDGWPMEMAPHAWPRRRRR